MKRLRLPTAILLLVPGAALAAPDFFAIRDQNPLVRSAYLPLPGIGAAAGEGAGWSLGAGLEWSNTVNIEQDAHEALLVDEESVELDLALARAAGAWRFRATLPVINRGPGVLDGAIDDWHRFFGLPRGDRPLRPRYQYAISYANDSGTTIVVPRGTALGDLALEAGRMLLERDGTSLGLYAGLEAPTGERSRLAGNGALDAALWLEAGTGLGARFALAARAGVSRPGGDALLPLARHVAFGTLALEWRAGARLAAALQLDAHGAVAARSALDFLGRAVLLTAGGRYRLGSGSVLEAAVIEDIEVDHSPDVTFHLGLCVPVGGATR